MMRAEKGETDNYIIRIYQRDPGEPGNLAGIIVVVETREQKVFAGISDAGGDLKTPDRTMVKRKKGQNK